MKCCSPFTFTIGRMEEGGGKRGTLRLGEGLFEVSEQH